VVTPIGKIPERICMHNGSKRVKSAKDMPFGGFVKKGHPHPHHPPNSENFALQKPFSFKTHINLGGSATKIQAQREIKKANINVKNDIYKNSYRRHSCTSKTAKIHCFVRFATYCIITTCSVECYWQCSDETVHCKSVAQQPRKPCH